MTEARPDDRGWRLNLLADTAQHAAGQRLPLSVRYGAAEAADAVISAWLTDPADQAAVLPALDAPHMPDMNRTETTQAMRRAALPRSGSLRHRMVMSLLNFPTTDDDLEVTLGRPHTSVSAARNGLMQQGWLQPYRIDGEVVKRPTRAGNPAIVWTITPAARLRLALDR